MCVCIHTVYIKILQSWNTCKCHTWARGLWAANWWRREVWRVLSINSIADSSPPPSVHNETPPRLFAPASSDGGFAARHIERRNTTSVATAHRELPLLSLSSHCALLIERLFMCLSWASFSSSALHHCASRCVTPSAFVCDAAHNFKDAFRLDDLQLI